jgi:hypothetical protein
MNSPNANGKDVVYIDVDDEITGVIDKVTSSSSKVVALVLPKRATVFQSIVNMKLLKKRADAAKKNIVLITSEQGLMPLASTVGLYVASTLQSKPEIPDATSAISDMPEADDDNPISMGNDDFDASREGKTPVGALAGSSAANLADDDGNIELDNSDLPEGSKTGDINALAAAGGSGKAAKKGKKDKSLKVPNFNRFRRIGIIAALVLILLIVGFFLANGALAKAKINITTKTSTVNAAVSPTLSTSATSVDLSSNTIPAQTQQQTKTATEQVSASGKQNNGTQATGTVTMTAQECGSNIFGSAPSNVPSGTGVATSGLTFITQQNTTFSNNGSYDPSSKCVTYQAKGSTSIQAQSGGSQYNVSNATFSVAGQSGVSASGSASGGTDNIVTIVQQSDIDAATTKAKTDISNEESGVKAQLEQNLQSSGLYPIESTFYTATPSVSPSVAAGTQASSVTVTESVTYTMYGAKQSNLTAVLDNSIDAQIDASKQSIQSDGLSQSSISVPTTGSGSTLDISIQTQATIGPHIDLSSLKTQVEGKPTGDVKSLISQLPGVTNVQVNLSPFWVSSVPKNPAKISISYSK